MPNPLLTVNKSGRAKNWMQGSVYVDASDVEEAISAVMAAVSPIGIGAFLHEYVSPYFEDQIVDTFANHGLAGVPGGSWPELAESTYRIRHQMGFHDDEAWNERTGEMLDHLVHTREYDVLPDGASVQIPGDTDDPVLRRKIETAQQGTADNALFPGAYTPPRPVLGMDGTDLVAVTKMLHVHVATFASKRMQSIGTSP